MEPQQHLTKPLLSTAFTSAANSTPNADLLTGVLLLQPFKGIHVEFAGDRLPLLPPDLLLFYGCPELLDCISLPRGDPAYIVKIMLDQDINHTVWALDGERNYKDNHSISA